MGRRASPIDEDPTFQRRNWAAERAGWALMAAVVALGLAGLLGPGPLSRAVATAEGTAAGGPGGASPARVAVSYERFLHARAPTAVRVETAVAPGATTLDLAVDRTYLSALDVRDVTPHPTATLIGADHVVYRFRLAPGTTRALVVFQLTPTAAGVVRGRLGPVTGPRPGLWHLVYP